MSSPRYWDAASRAHGAGIMIDALVARPSRKPSNVAELVAWLRPSPSALMITNRLSAGCPRRSASSVIGLHAIAGHPGAGHVAQRPRPATRAAAAWAARSARCAVLGSIDKVRA